MIGYPKLEMNVIFNLVVSVLGMLTPIHGQHDGIGSFVLVPKGLHWRDANQYCRTHYGTQLVTIKNETKNEQVRQAASKARHGLIWIGYNDLAHEGKWSWADGSPKGFEKWKPGEPNNDKNEDVAEMIVGTGQWNDVGDGPRIFGCDYPEGQTIERDAYRLVLTKKTYDAAQMSCFSRYRTSIATISNEKQNTLIFNLAIQASGDRFDDLWIGLSDHLTEGIWLWEDRTPVTFQYWADGRPDNAHGGQHYTHMKMYDNGKWEDNDKNHEYPFVCNYRRFASVPNHKLTWHDANEFCKKHYKTQLGTITNKDSYQAAKGISTHNNDNSGIWFGLRQFDIPVPWIFTFRYVGNELIQFSQWSKFPPGKCVLFKHNTGWETADCSQEHYFVCDNFIGGMFNAHLTVLK